MNGQWMKRATAFFSVIAFVATNHFSLPFAYADTPASSSIQTALPVAINSLKIPSEIGKIEETFKGAGDEAVILVQNAHAVVDAQKSIQKLIEHFQKQYGVDLVAVEGTSSVLDAQIFKSFPDKELLRKVFAEYLEKEELTGVEAAALFSQAPSVYQGVENWQLYEEGLRLFSVSSAKEPVLLEKLSALEREVEARKKQVFSKKLLKIDSALQSFQENHKGLIQVLKLLSQVKRPQEGTELALLLEESARGETAGASIEIEVKRLAEKIEKYLEIQTRVSAARKEDLRLFHEKFQAFRTSRISAPAFALFLKELISGKNIPFKFSNRLSYLVANQKRMKAIEGTKLFRDFEHYVRDVKEGLFRNQQERQIDQESRNLELLHKLTRLEISRQEWKELKSEVVPEGMKNHFAFYENASRRDQAFSENLISIMRERKAKASLLVAGGFHTEGLTQRLKEKNISYVLLMPSITSIPGETHYREHMQGNVSWKDYFEVENGRINFYKAFVRATRDKFLKQSKEEPGVLLKSWRDQIIRDLVKQEKTTSVGKYTVFMDEMRKDEREKILAEKFSKIDSFIGKLRGLDNQGQLTGRNILKLLQPSTIPAPTETKFFPVDFVHTKGSLGAFGFDMKPPVSVELPTEKYTGIIPGESFATRSEMRMRPRIIDDFIPEFNLQTLAELMPRLGISDKHFSEDKVSTAFTMIGRFETPSEAAQAHSPESTPLLLKMNVVMNANKITVSFFTQIGERWIPAGEKILVYNKTSSETDEAFDRVLGMIDHHSETPDFAMPSGSPGFIFEDISYELYKRLPKDHDALTKGLSIAAFGGFVLIIVLALIVQQLRPRLAEVERELQTERVQKLKDLIPGLTDDEIKTVEDGIQADAKGQRQIEEGLAETQQEARQAFELIRGLSDKEKETMRDWLQAHRTPRSEVRAADSAGSVLDLVTGLVTEHRYNGLSGIGLVNAVRETLATTNYQTLLTRINENHQRRQRQRTPADWIHNLINGYLENVSRSETRNKIPRGLIGELHELHRSLRMSPVEGVLVFWVMSTALFLPFIFPSQFIHLPQSAKEKKEQIASPNSKLEKPEEGKRMFKPRSETRVYAGDIDSEHLEETIEYMLRHDEGKNIRYGWKGQGISETITTDTKSIRDFVLQYPADPEVKDPRFRLTRIEDPVQPPNSPTVWLYIEDDPVHVDKTGNIWNVRIGNDSITLELQNTHNPSSLTDAPEKLAQFLTRNGIPASSKSYPAAGSGNTSWSWIVTVEGPNKKKIEIYLRLPHSVKRLRETIANVLASRSEARDDADTFRRDSRRDLQGLFQALRAENPQPAVQTFNESEVVSILAYVASGSGAEIFEAMSRDQSRQALEDLARTHRSEMDILLGKLRFDPQSYQSDMGDVDRNTIIAKLTEILRSEARNNSGWEWLYGERGENPPGLTMDFPQWVMISGLVIGLMSLPFIFPSYFNREPVTQSVGEENGQAAVPSGLQPKMPEMPAGKKDSRKRRSETRAAKKVPEELLANEFFIKHAQELVRESEELKAFISSQPKDLTIEEIFTMIVKHKREGKIYPQEMTSGLLRFMGYGQPEEFIRKAVGKGYLRDAGIRRNSFPPRPMTIKNVYVLGANGQNMDARLARLRPVMQFILHSKTLGSPFTAQPLADLLGVDARTLITPFRDAVGFGYLEEMPEKLRSGHGKGAILYRLTETGKQFASHDKSAQPLHRANAEAAIDTLITTRNKQKRAEAVTTLMKLNASRALNRRSQALAGKKGPQNARARQLIKAVLTLIKTRSEARMYEIRSAHKVEILTARQTKNLHLESGHKYLGLVLTRATRVTKIKNRRVQNKPVYKIILKDGEVEKLRRNIKEDSSLKSIPEGFGNSEGVEALVVFPGGVKGLPVKHEKLGYLVALREENKVVLFKYPHKANLSQDQLREVLGSAQVAVEINFSAPVFWHVPGRLHIPFLVRSEARKPEESEKQTSFRGWLRNDIKLSDKTAAVLGPVTMVSAWLLVFSMAIFFTPTSTSQNTWYETPEMRQVQDLIVIRSDEEVQVIAEWLRADDKGKKQIEGRLGEDQEIQAILKRMQKFPGWEVQEMSVWIQAHPISFQPRFEADGRSSAQSEVRVTDNSSKDDQRRPQIHDYDILSAAVHLGFIGVLVMFGWMIASTPRREKEDGDKSKPAVTSPRSKTRKDEGINKLKKLIDINPDRQLERSPLEELRSEARTKQFSKNVAETLRSKSIAPEMLRAIGVDAVNGLARKVVGRKSIESNRIDSGAITDALENPQFVHTLKILSNNAIQALANDLRTMAIGNGWGMEEAMLMAVSHMAYGGYFNTRLAAKSSELKEIFENIKTIDNPALSLGGQDSIGKAGLFEAIKNLAIKGFFHEKGMEKLKALQEIFEMAPDSIGRVPIKRWTEEFERLTLSDFFKNNGSAEGLAKLQKLKNIVALTRWDDSVEGSYFTGVGWPQVILFNLSGEAELFELKAEGISKLSSLEKLYRELGAYAPVLRTLAETMSSRKVKGHGFYSRLNAEQFDWIVDYVIEQWKTEIGNLALQDIGRTGENSSSFVDKLLTAYDAKFPARSEARTENSKKYKSKDVEWLTAVAHGGMIAVLLMFGWAASLVPPPQGKTDKDKSKPNVVSPRSKVRTRESGFNEFKRILDSDRNKNLGESPLQELRSEARNKLNITKDNAGRFRSIVEGLYPDQILPDTGIDQTSFAGDLKAGIINELGVLSAVAAHILERGGGSEGLIQALRNAPIDIELGLDLAIQFFDELLSQKAGSFQIPSDLNRYVDEHIKEAGSSGIVHELQKYVSKAENAPELNRLMTEHRDWLQQIRNRFAAAKIELLEVVGEITNSRSEARTDEQSSSPVDLVKLVAPSYINDEIDLSRRKTIFWGVMSLVSLALTVAEFFDMDGWEGYVAGALGSVVTGVLIYQTQKHVKGVKHWQNIKRKFENSAASSRSEARGRNWFPTMILGGLVIGGILAYVWTWPGQREIEKPAIPKEAQVAPAIKKRPVPVEEEPEERAPLLEETGSLTVHERAVSAIAISRDGKKIATGSYGISGVRDIPSGNNLVKIKEGSDGYGGGVKNIGFSPDGEEVVTGHVDKVNFWDPKSGELLRTIGPLADFIEIGTLLFSGDGKELVVSNEQRITGKLNVQILNRASGRLIRKLDDPSDEFGTVTSMVISKDGKIIVTGSINGFVHIWDYDSGKLLTTLRHDNSGEIFRDTFVAISEDGERIAAAGKNRLIKIWARPSGELLQTIQTSSAMGRIFFTPDEESIIGERFTPGNNNVGIWNFDSGTITHILPTLHPPTAIAIGPDKTVYVGDSKGIVHVWDLSASRSEARVWTSLSRVRGNVEEIWDKKREAANIRPVVNPYAVEGFLQRIDVPGYGKAKLKNSLDPNPPAEGAPQDGTPSWMMDDHSPLLLSKLLINGRKWRMIVPGDAAVPYESLLVPDENLDLVLNNERANYDLLTFYRQTGLYGYANSHGIGVLRRLHVHNYHEPLPINKLNFNLVNTVGEVTVATFEKRSLDEGQRYEASNIVLQSEDDYELARALTLLVNILLKQKIPHIMFYSPGKVIVILRNNDPGELLTVEQEYVQEQIIGSLMFAGLLAYPKSIGEAVTEEKYWEILKALTIDSRGRLSHEDIEYLLIKNLSHEKSLLEGESYDSSAFDPNPVRITDQSDSDYSWKITDIQPNEAAVTIHQRGSTGPILSVWLERGGVLPILGKQMVIEVLDIVHGNDRASKNRVRVSIIPRSEARVLDEAAIETFINIYRNPRLHQLAAEDNLTAADYQKEFSLPEESMDQVQLWFSQLVEAGHLTSSGPEEPEYQFAPWLKELITEFQTYLIDTRAGGHNHVWADKVLRILREHTYPNLKLAKGILEGLFIFAKWGLEMNMHPGPKIEARFNRELEQIFEGYRNESLEEIKFEVETLMARLKAGFVDLDKLILPYLKDVPGVTESQIAEAQREIKEVYGLSLAAVRPEDQELVQYSFLLGLVLHANQPRASKGDNRPYMIHVAGVTRLLLEEFKLKEEITDPEEVRDGIGASWMHDGLEDAKKGRWGKNHYYNILVGNEKEKEAALREDVGSLMERYANAKVRENVARLSKPDYEGFALADEVAIEARYYLDLRTAPLATQLIKAADFSFNLGDMINHPDRTFPWRFFVKRLGPVLGFLEVAKISAKSKAQVVRFIREAVDANNRKNTELIAAGKKPLEEAPEILSNEQEAQLRAAEEKYSRSETRMKVSGGSATPLSESAMRGKADELVAKMAVLVQDFQNAITSENQGDLDDIILNFEGFVERKRDIEMELDSLYGGMLRDASEALRNLAQPETHRILALLTDFDRLFNIKHQLHVISYQKKRELLEIAGRFYDIRLVGGGLLLEYSKDDSAPPERLLALIENFGWFAVPGPRNWPNERTFIEGTFINSDRLQRFHPQLYSAVRRRYVAFKNYLGQPEWGKDRPIEEYIRMLETGNADSILTAAQAISDRSQYPEIVETIPALIKVLDQNVGPLGSIREEVASALGQMGPVAFQALPALLRVLTDANPYVREAAATALGQISPFAIQVIQALSQALEDDWPMVRWAALIALYKIFTAGNVRTTTSPAAVELIAALNKAVSKNPDMSLRKDALQFLRIIDVARSEVRSHATTQVQLHVVTRLNKDKENRPEIQIGGPKAEFISLEEPSDLQGALFPLTVDILKNENTFQLKRTINFTLRTSWMEPWFYDPQVADAWLSDLLPYGTPAHAFRARNGKIMIELNNQHFDWQESIYENSALFEAMKALGVSVVAADSGRTFHLHATKEFEYSIEKPFAAAALKEIAEGFRRVLPLRSEARSPTEEKAVLLLAIQTIQKQAAGFKDGTITLKTSKELRKAVQLVQGSDLINLLDGAEERAAQAILELDLSLMKKIEKLRSSMNRWFHDLVPFFEGFSMDEKFQPVFPLNDLINHWESVGHRLEPYWGLQHFIAWHVVAMRQGIEKLEQNLQFLIPPSSEEKEKMVTLEVGGEYKVGPMSVLKVLEIRPASPGEKKGGVKGEVAWNFELLGLKTDKKKTGTTPFDMSLGKGKYIFDGDIKVARPIEVSAGKVTFRLYPRSLRSEARADEEDIIEPEGESLSSKSLAVLSKKDPRQKFIEVLQSHFLRTLLDGKEFIDLERIYVRVVEEGQSFTDRDKEKTELIIERVLYRAVMHHANRDLKSQFSMEQRLQGLTQPARRIIHRVADKKRSAASVSPLQFRRFLELTWDPEIEGISPKIKKAILADSEAYLRGRVFPGRKRSTLRTFEGRLNEPQIELMLNLTSKGIEEIERAAKFSDLSDVLGRDEHVIDIWLKGFLDKHAQSIFVNGDLRQQHGEMQRIAAEAKQKEEQELRENWNRIAVEFVDELIKLSPHKARTRAGLGTAKIRLATRTGGEVYAGDVKKIRTLRDLKRFLKNHPEAVIQIASIVDSVSGEAKRDVLQLSLRTLDEAMRIGKSKSAGLTSLKDYQKMYENVLKEIKRKKSLRNRFFQPAVRSETRQGPRIWREQSKLPILQVWHENGETKLIITMDSADGAVPAYEQHMIYANSAKSLKRGLLDYYNKIGRSPWLIREYGDSQASVKEDELEMLPSNPAGGYGPAKYRADWKKPRSIAYALNHADMPHFRVLSGKAAKNTDLFFMLHLENLAETFFGGAAEGHSTLWWREPSAAGFLMTLQEIFWKRVGDEVSHARSSLKETGIELRWAEEPLETTVRNFREKVQGSWELMEEKLTPKVIEEMGKLEVLKEFNKLFDAILWSHNVLINHLAQNSKGWLTLHRRSETRNDYEVTYVYRDDETLKFEVFRQSDSQLLRGDLDYMPAEADDRTGKASWYLSLSHEKNKFFILSHPEDFQEIKPLLLALSADLDFLYLLKSDSPEKNTPSDWDTFLGQMPPEVKDKMKLTPIPEKLTEAARQEVLDQTLQEIFQGLNAKKKKAIARLKRPLKVDRAMDGLILRALHGKQIYELVSEEKERLKMRLTELAETEVNEGISASLKRNFGTAEIFEYFPIVVTQEEQSPHRIINVGARTSGSKVIGFSISSEGKFSAYFLTSLEDFNHANKVDAVEVGLANSQSLLRGLVTSLRNLNPDREGDILTEMKGHADVWRNVEEFLPLKWKQAIQNGRSEARRAPAKKPLSLVAALLFGNRHQVADLQSKAAAASVRSEVEHKGFEVLTNEFIGIALAEEPKNEQQEMKPIEIDPALDTVIKNMRQRWDGLMPPAGTVRPNRTTSFYLPKKGNGNIDIFMTALFERGVGLGIDRVVASGEGASEINDYAQQMKKAGLKFTIVNPKDVKTFGAPVLSKGAQIPSSNVIHLGVKGEAEGWNLLLDEVEAEAQMMIDERISRMEFDWTTSPHDEINSFVKGISAILFEAAVLDWEILKDAKTGERQLSVTINRPHFMSRLQGLVKEVKARAEVRKAA
ncbi:MAG: HEAT repeat domain-containing protein [Candidatus Omnitrophica bacterium]|nr:HEAT repeat domain-containing protein [Candidatus Omnitrophota bacterium]